MLAERFNVRLILMRHAMAAVHGSWSDTDRPLTAGGEEQAQQSANGLACLDLKVAKILSSPATRCRSTADIVANTLRVPAADLQIVDGLSLGTSLSNAVELLQLGGKQGTVLLVGHQPVLERLASTLLLGDVELPLQMTPASCIVLHCNLRQVQPAAVLLWFMRSYELGMLRCDPDAPAGK